MRNGLILWAISTFCSKRHWAALAFIVLLAAASAFADSSSVAQRTVTKIADGIYVIRHKDAPNGFPQGNTTVIIGDQDVLVVDSCYLPSSAREDIAQIRQWTDKPVRYLLNTHWHADHTRGNATYAGAFPSISIIAQTATRELVKGNYADHPENAAMIVQRDVAVYRRYLEAGKTDDGTALGEDDKKQLKDTLAGADSVAAEFTGLVPRLPNVTFERELDLDLGNRAVQIKFLGRGNTAGDAIAFLPKEKILIAGDLVVHPGPYMGSGFPTEWSKTLERMIEMNPQIIVPGHGEILHDPSYLSQLDELAKTVTEQVRQQYYRLTNRATLDDVRKAIDMDALKARFGGYFKDDAQNGEPYLDLGGLIKVAYEEIQPR
jgi:glyoxylase-like metal-dependent hydrolase (beta-lactamase superfamily II)